MTGNSLGQVLISSNEFFGNTALYGGAIYLDNALMKLHLIDNVFQSNSAIDGGAIYKISQS